MKTIKFLFAVLCICTVLEVGASATFAYFTAQSQDGIVDLQWATLSEFNNAVFNIERSSDTENWTSVQSITGAGYSNIAIEYEATDNNSPQGNQFYRLRMTEITGAHSFSPVINVYVSPGPVSMPSIFPNPAEGMITISTGSLFAGKISVINAVGQVMMEEISTTEAAQGVDISDLPEGMYYLQIRAGEEKSLTKFFKR